jgi:hypothetical protein
LKRVAKEKEAMKKIVTTSLFILAVITLLGLSSASAAEELWVIKNGVLNKKALTPAATKSNDKVYLCEGEASTTYVCKSSTTLSGFSNITITSGSLTTDVHDDATFTVAAADTKRFYVVEE